MGARRLPAPEGYSVAQLDNGDYIVLITPRDEAGRLINFGVLFDPAPRARSGVRLPLTWRKRAAAISAARDAELTALRKFVKEAFAGLPASVGEQLEMQEAADLVAAPAV